MYKMCVLLVLLLCSPSYGNDITQHITMTPWDIPGTYNIRYEGICGRILNEATRRAERQYRRQLFEQEQSGQIDYIEYLNRNINLSMNMSDMTGGNFWWWKENFWEYYPESKGGASEIKVTYVIGKTIELVDFGPIVVTNAGDVKWKSYTKIVDLKSDNNYKSGTDWVVTFSPSARFSAGQLLNSIEDSIRAIGTKLRFRHRIRYKPIVEATFNLSYNFRRKDIRFNFDIVFLQW